MLRASIDIAGLELDLRAIVDDQCSTGPDGADEILAFTRALVQRSASLASARDALRTMLGDPAAAAVAGAVGNFEMMNRILDATGVPTPHTLHDLEQQLRS